MSAPKLIYVALRLLLGATFLLSAYTKTIDFSSFELRLLDIGIIGWGLAPYLASALIIAEFAIGFYFLSLFIRGKSYNRLTTGFLVVFTVYLGLLWASKGNDLNCGCMGETIPFTPLQAIVKNLLTMTILWLVYRFERQNLALKTIKTWHHLLYLLLGISSAATNIPNFLNPAPVALDKPSFFDRNYLQESSTLTGGSFNFEPHQHYLIAFLSMSCGHCRIAADRLSSIQKLDEALPIFIVLNGDSAELKNYREQRSIKNIPFALLPAQPFIKLAGTAVPVLFIVQDDSVRYNLSLYQLNGKSLHSLMN